jgi:hypothetical protein
MITVSLPQTRSSRSAGAENAGPSAGSLSYPFAALFGLAAPSVSNAFKGLEVLQGNFAIAGNLIYFSFVTLTTIGYGDIVPLHPYARGLANLRLSSVNFIQLLCLPDL